MQNIDFSEENQVHELIPYYDGHAVKLQPLKLHRYIKRQLNALFSLKENAEFPGSRPTVLSHDTFAQISQIHSQFFEKRKVSGGEKL